MYKLDRAKKKDQTERQSIELFTPDPSKAIDGVKKSIDSLYELINDKPEVDLSELTGQVRDLSNVIDIKDQISELKQAIKDNKPEKMTIDFTKLIKTIESNKPIVNIDLDKVEKAIIEVQQKVQDLSTVEQAPDQYQPVRRVVKVGNRLIFDDQPTTAGRSGGGSSDLTLSGTLVSGSNPVPVDITDASVVITQTAPTTLIAFVTTVTTAGTRVQLASNAGSGYILEAPSTNTGLIYVGGSTVSSTVYGAELQPGQSCSVAIDNTSKLYIDSSVSGNKLAVIGS